MAHYTSVRGEVSELVASCLLMTELGWEVSKPLVPETYDLLGRDPQTGAYYRVQVKTVRRRHDRDNRPVVYATNSKGDAYMPADVDYIVGVEGNIAYLFDCRGKKEYWLNEENTEASATKYTLLGA